MAGNVKYPGYDELAAQVAALREQVRALKAEVHRLRAENARLRGEAPADGDDTVREAATAVPSRGRKAPPRWAKANVVRVSVRRPRKPRAPVPGRRREVPDRIVVYAPAVCPGCAAPLGRGRVVGRRQVLDLPPVRAEVVEHRVLERTCRRCGARCRGVMPDLRAAVGAGRRLAWGVAALVAVLRTKLRLPIAQLQWLLAQQWQLHVSVGTLCGLLDEAARAVRPAYEGFLAEARASPVLHLDETSWREAGRSGWVWTLTTPTVRLFRFSVSRAGAVARALLGDDTEGVIVSDFYTAYDQLDGRHQRCWAHLLRDIHDLKAQHPEDARLHAWAAGMHALYREAVAWVAAAGDSPPAEREPARQRFETAALALGRAEPAGVPHAALCQRVERYHAELFTFVADPAVPPTNNAAERALRPLVVGRKISGGTRSTDGTQTRMLLQSVIATWDLRGLDPVAELLTLLRAPRTPLVELPSV
jgi:transposase